MRKEKRLVGRDYRQVLGWVHSTIMTSQVYAMMRQDHQREFLDIMSDEVSPYTSFNIQLNQAWAINCTLMVSLDIDYNRGYVEVDSKKYKFFQPKVEVSWSSTGRTPASARAAICLYTQVTDLACLIESYMREGEIYEHVEFPKLSPEVA